MGELVDEKGLAGASWAGDEDGLQGTKGKGKGMDVGASRRCIHDHRISAGGAYT